MLQELLRIDTSNPPGRETPAAMLLKQYLETAGLECELVARTPERANLICRIAGSGGGPSLALLGHTDVVPATEPDWTHPPFSGHVDEEGYVWGRGATDMKNETATRAVTMAILARSGFRPNGDLVFVAQADEEDGTEKVGLQWLRDERPDLAVDYSIDEGGGSRLELADGRVVISLNVGEKATLPVIVWAEGVARHASVPTRENNSILVLGEVIKRIAAYTPRRRLLPETRRLLETLVGPFEDADLESAIEKAGKLHTDFGDDFAAIFSTTIAQTRLHGSRARNVIPARAGVECDCRVLPGTGPADLQQELEEAIGDLPVHLEFLEPPTGGTSSPVGTPLFEACQSFFDERDPGAKLLPKISSGFTDSHFMRERFGTVAYGIWPFRSTPLGIMDEGVHNVNERVKVDDLVYATRFHLHVVRRVGAFTS